MFVISNTYSTFKLSKSLWGNYKLLEYVFLFRSSSELYLLGLNVIRISHTLAA